MKLLRSISLGIFTSLVFGAGVGHGQHSREIVVYPDSCHLTPRSRQQLAVRVPLPDGTSRDVTRLATFTSTDPLRVGVNAEGLVSSFEQPGQAWIIVRYGHRLGRCRVVVKAAQPPASPPFAPSTLIDRHLAVLWKDLGIRPVSETDDYTFLRRVTLHLAGRFPTEAEIERYLKDRRPDRDAQLVDRLLGSADHATHFANLWADALRLPHVTRVQQNPEAITLHHWIRESVAADRSIKDFVANLLEAHGTAKTRPAVVWQATASSPLVLARDCATVFAARRLRCARCHRHPEDGSSIEQFRGFAACFEQVARQQVNARTVWLAPFKTPVRRMWRLTPITFRELSPQATPPALPDGTRLIAGPREDYRRFVTEWLLAGKRPRLAEAVVNFTWAYLFSRGLVDPADDIRPDNPPVAPELFAALVDDFIDHGWSMRRLLKKICTSRAYRLASSDQAGEACDVCTSGTFPVQTIRAGVLYGALQRIHGRPSRSVVPRATKQAAELQAEYWSVFRPYEVRLRVFNPFADLTNDDRCERHHLLMARGPEWLLELPLLQREMQLIRISVTRIAVQRISNAEAAERLFLLLLGRPPTREQMAAIEEFLGDGRSSRSQRLQQVAAALMQTREFLTIR